MNDRPALDALQAFYLANSFIEGAMRCEESVADPETGALVSPTAPALVNAAFAAELYLKSIILRRDKVKGHDLERLFMNALNDDERGILAKHYIAHIDFGNKDLYSSLSGFAHAFTEWRYVYEADERQVDSWALKIFVRAAYLTTRELEPGWKVGNYLHSRIMSNDGIVAVSYSIRG